MAPEITKSQSYNEKVDIWSIGIITYFLLTGYPPFGNKDRDDIIKNINTCNINKSN